MFVLYQSITLLNVLFLLHHHFHWVPMGFLSIRNEHSSIIAGRECCRNFKMWLQEKDHYKIWTWQCSRNPSATRSLFLFSTLNSLFLPSPSSFPSLYFLCPSPFCTSFLSPPSCLSLQLSCLSFSTLLLSIPSLIPFSFLFCLSQISPQCFLYIMQILCFHKIENVFLIDSYTSHALSLPLLLRCKLLSLSLSFVFFYDAFCSLLVAFPQNDVISLTQTLLFNDFLFYLVILEDLPYKTVSPLLIGHLVYWVSSRITSYVLPLR